MKVGEKIIITDMSHEHLCKKGVVVYEGKHGQRVVELENGTLTIVNNSELAWQ